MADHSPYPNTGIETPNSQAPGNKSANLLLPQHAEMLAMSAIGQDIIAARGYCSITRKADLTQLGFAETQRVVPTLLVPIWSATGEVSLYHHRPDKPRIRDGKPAKYEFPAGSRMIIDVHPTIKGKIGDPNVPLLITEGVKKADAAITQGLVCVALIGTWNWRGTNEYGGKTALPDWEYIAVKATNDRSREVYICYDSDVMLKRQVHQALARLSQFVESRGAKVNFIYLPHGLNGQKVGLDDFLATG
ncbi:MAG TPA: DUF3854 domain-containing protein [Chloroflexia bacterium]|nr:DUF3854 domain-containing protein [Chloroflexia bacterium]